MGKRRKIPPNGCQPRVSKALNRLRDELGLGQADWLAFLQFAHADELGPDAMRRYLDHGIADRAAPVRHAAYRIGLKEFGPAYVGLALEDPAASVRKWATGALASSGPGKTRPRD